MSPLSLAVLIIDLLLNGDNDQDQTGYGGGSGYGAPATGYSAPAESYGSPAPQASYGAAPAPSYSAPACTKDRDCPEELFCGQDKNCYKCTKDEHCTGDLVCGLDKQCWEESGKMFGYFCGEMGSGQGSLNTNFNTQVAQSCITNCKIGKVRIGPNPACVVGSKIP